MTTSDHRPATWPGLIVQAAGELSAAGLESPAAEARSLAEFVAGKNPALANDPAEGEVARFHSLVASRAARVPLQHLTERMYFRYLELRAEPGCFIVRPETEVVAGEAIEAARRACDSHGSALVVDLCTGSAAIALAVATEVAGATVHAVELSESAFAVATKNNTTYGGVVNLYRADARTALPELEGRCDVVVTNPPYVPPHTAISPEVDADPALALWGGGDDGLEIPRALVARAAQLLAPGGILIMEHAETQGEALCRAAQAAGFTNAHTGHDLAGRPRYLWAQRR